MSLFACLDAGDQPYEVFRGAPFITHWVIVADEQEAAWSGVAIGQRAAFEISHSWAALDAYGPAELARYCIQTPALPTPPAGKQVASYSLADTAGVVSVQATFAAIPPPPVPPEVSAMQAQLVLHAAGRLDAVETAISGASRDVQIYWAKATTFHRTHPVLLSMAQALQMSSADLDDLFRQAAALA